MVDHQDAALSGGGCFVVFEGIDGAGTTTQAERYRDYLKSKRRLAHMTHEPSTGPVGSLIRQILTHRVTVPSGSQAEIMALLFAADRLDHLEVEVTPFLRDGYVVIADRYDLSSLAYQSTTASLEDTDPANVVEWIRTLNRDARRPDVTVVLNVSPDVASSRRRSRGGMVELFDQNELQARLSEAYKHAEALVPTDKIIHIDGNGAADDVAAEVVTALTPYVEKQRR
jgi:dTMP kinase